MAKKLRERSRKERLPLSHLEQVEAAEASLRRVATDWSVSVPIQRESLRWLRDSLDQMLKELG